MIPLSRYARRVSRGVWKRNSFGFFPWKGHLLCDAVWFHDTNVSPIPLSAFFVREEKYMYTEIYIQVSDSVGKKIRSAMEEKGKTLAVLGLMKENNTRERINNEMTDT